MAFGRSNSLTLNTGAVNSSFAAQQSQPGQQPATAAGSLFGGGSSLFGGQANAAQPASTGLFGAQPTNTSSQPAQSGLFGSAPATTAAPSLFGSQTTQAQPAATAGSSLFGGSLFGNKPAENKPATPSLFGAQPAAKPATTSLFGQPAASTNTGLFGSQPAASTSTGLFGSQPAAQSGSLFGAKPQQNAQTMADWTQRAPQQQPSLLSASRYSLGQPAPFTGRLSMGQGATTQTTSTPAAKLSWDNVRPTTRFTDLVDPAREQLEAIDKMISQQEAFCKQIEAFLPVHGTNLESLAPDIALIEEKVDSAEQALVTDAQGVQQGKDLTMADAKDVARCERIGENLRLPPQYHYAPASRGYHASRSNPSATDKVLGDDHDTDLVGNYFTPAAEEMRRMLATYQSNLSEIESHIQTIEAGTVAQAQSLSQQRAHSENGASVNDSIRQLSETLRGFEGTILSTAAKVGTCRESITELSLGRSNRHNNGAW